jgi:starch-binding outer membrane protein SusE/F
MKLLSKLCVFALVIGLLFSCEKKISEVQFFGGTSPVLKASSTAPLVLTIANANNEAIRFEWTNPNYQFSTGPSSHNVSYTLEVDTVGANFNSRLKQSATVSSDLQMSLTVKQLNIMLTKLEFMENVPHHVEFRLVSTIGGAVPLYSNAIRVMVTPYLDVAVPVPPTGELYITGSAMVSDWTNSPPASQKFTKISNTLYTITVNLTPGKLYKFLSTQGQWQPQYGGSSANGGNLGFNMGGGSDPDAIPTPAIAGQYKITVNFKTGQYTVEKV